MLLISALLSLIPLILTSATLSDDLTTARVIGAADGDNILALTASNQSIIIKLGGIDGTKIGQTYAK